MSDDAYTYTTISAGPGEPTRIGVSFYLDDLAWISVPGIGAGHPYLSVTHGEVSVKIGPRTRALTAEDARIARTLADHAAMYAAEVERLCAADAADPAGEPGTAAA